MEYKNIVKLFDDEKTKIGITQTELAKIVFRHKTADGAVSFYSRLKNGKLGHLKSKELNSIANYFGVNVIDLISEEIETKSKDYNAHVETSKLGLDQHIETLVDDLRYVIKHGDYAMTKTITNMIRNVKDSIISGNLFRTKMEDHGINQS